MEKEYKRVFLKDDLNFRITEDLEFKYYIDIQERHNGYVLTVTRADNNFVIEPDKHNWESCEFLQTLPQSKQAMIKMLGGWIKSHIWAHLVAPYKQAYRYGSMEHSLLNANSPLVSKQWPSLKKSRSFAYLRSIKISSVIVGRAWKKLQELSGCTQSELQDMEWISKKLYRPKNKRAVMYTDVSEQLLCIKKHTDKELYDMLMRDLKRYTPAMGKYILDKLRLIDVEIDPLTQDRYRDMLVTAPLLVRKNKYGLTFELATVEKYNGPIPTDRWGWFMLRFKFSIMDLLTDRYTEPELKEFIDKLPNSNINMWHYFKKARHIDGPYSTQKISHIFQTVRDGIRIYNTIKDNPYGIPAVPVKGSPLRMLRNAIYNHRQEQEYTKKRRLDCPNHPMALPPVNLPDWIENIRIKTVHEIISAGIECEHCIGSYSNSSDIFVREKDICAQIDRNNLTVVQCFDTQDRITKVSDNLKGRLNRDLSKLMVKK